MPINFLENTEKEYFVDRPDVQAILCFIIGISVVCFLLVTTSNGWLRKNAIENFRKDEVIGKISSKALDSSNRDTPYVVIDNDRHYISNLTWNKIAVGDSVSKIKGANDFFIIKKDTVITITTAIYGEYLDSIYAVH